MRYGRIISNMKNFKNDNLDFYENIDVNFDKACELCEREFSHNELINMLKSGNIPEKQISALKLDSVYDDNEVNILLSNLTGCDGKIREAAALKINKILRTDVSKKELFSRYSAEPLGKATIDINANICRLVIDSAVLLKNYNNFSKNYTEKVVLYAQEALKELSKFIFRDKKYVINKQLFKLYWCLEALNFFHNFVPDNILKEIIVECASQSEYTIREKIAQLILSVGKYDDILEKLKQDDNYYVRQKALNH